MTKVRISQMTFGESEFVRGNKVWRAESLWAVDLTDHPFPADNLSQFIFQCKRVQDCSLNYPIILDDCGQIADGYHRLCKAILEGRETIKAIRLEEMPAPDRIEEE